eukprot:7382481-Prymnesium_polylepis.1
MRSPFDPQNSAVQVARAIYRLLHARKRPGDMATHIPTAPTRVVAAHAPAHPPLSSVSAHPSPGAPNVPSPSLGANDKQNAQTIRPGAAALPC